MNKMKKLKERVLSIVLAFAMVISLFAGSANEVHASMDDICEPLILNSATLNASTVLGEGDTEFLMDADGGFFSSAKQANGAFPDDGKIETSDGIPYQLAWTGSSAYAGNDSIRFVGTRSGSIVTSDSVTMKISTFGVYDKVAVLGTAGGFADNKRSLNFKVTLTYADNTSSETTYSLYDWYRDSWVIEDYGMGYKVFQRLNKDGISIDRDFGNNGGPILQSMQIECDETKVLKDITFEIANTESSVANEYGIYAAIYAVTGVLKSGAPSRPVAAVQATDANGFTVGWEAVEAAERYSVDVSTYPTFLDDQGNPSFVSGYLNKIVDGTSTVVEGLDTGRTYYCRVRSVSADGAQGSSSETVSAVPTEAAPEPTAPINITKQPESVTVNMGERATFTVEAESTTGSTLSYQWQVDYGSGNGFQRTYENGEKTATLTTYSVDASYDGYKYRCVITDTNGNSVTSDEATVTVNVQRPTQVTGVSISKTADGYKVTGLGDPGEGNRWAYYPYKLNEGQNLDEAIAACLNTHLTEGPWCHEIANSFDESFEITAYTSPNTGVPESLDNYDYIEIVKLDADWMIREVAVLALPKTAAEPAGIIASLENCVSVNGKTVSFNLDPNKEYVIGVATSEELGLPGSMFNGTCQESYNMLMNGIGMPVLPKSEFTTAKIKEYLTDPLGVGPIMTNATTGLVSSHDPITVTDGALIVIGEVRSEDKVEYVDDQYSERNGDYYITYGVYAVFIPAAETSMGETYDITFDVTNYEGEWALLCVYDADENYVTDIYSSNGTVEMPEGGHLKVFASEEVRIEAEGAESIEFMDYFGPDEGYGYRIDGITGDTTVVINSITGSEDIFIDAVEAQLDWNNVPTLEVGMDNTTLPEFSENPVTITGEGVADYNYGWAIQVDESFKVEGNDEYNEALQYYIDNYNGWAMLEMILYYDSEYRINAEDTYALFVYIVHEDGYTFGVFGTDEYEGTINSNVPVMAAIPDDDGMVTFFKLGTLDEMEEEKNPTVVTAPVITGQPQNASVLEGATATFTVTATGENVTYQWQIDRNDGNGFVNISEATSASYTTSAVNMNCNGYKYQCIVTNEGGSVTSTSATLTVTAAPAVHTHTMTQVAATAATCTAEGNTAYYKCTSCGNLYADANGTTATTLAEVKVAKLGHDWSGEWTVTKEATATEEGKKETLCVRGCGQKKVVAIPVIGSSVDNSGIEKDAEVTPDAPIGAVTLNNTTEELLAAANIFNETERQQIAAGVDARVWLEVSCTDESTISEAERASVEQLAATIMGENLNITYFEADLFKQVGNGDATPVPEPGVEIEITIAIPAELLNADGTVTREYKIIRLHENEEPIVISGTFNAATGEFSFTTDRFSTYAIVYSDTPVNGGENTPGTETNPTPDNNATPNDTVVKPDEKDSVPKTGDSNMTLYAFVLMLLSGAGILFGSKRKEEYSK